MFVSACHTRARVALSTTLRSIRSVDEFMCNLRAAYYPTPREMQLIGCVFLLVLTPAVANPAGGVTSSRIPVGPVHHATLRVPLVFTGKLDWRAGPQTFDPRRKVEVIRDEHRLPGWQADDEPLMPGALRIVFQHLGNDPVTADFDMALMIAVGRGECIFVAA